jgi:hypothetical protein
MTTAPGDMVVAAGDLNAKTGTAQPWALPPWLHCQKRGSQRNAPSCCLTRTAQVACSTTSCTSIDLLNLTGIAPAWRLPCPALVQPLLQGQWSAAEPLPRASRIDHFLAPPSVTCPDVRGSDHVPPRLTLALARAPAPAAAPAAASTFKSRATVPTSIRAVVAKFMACEVWSTRYRGDWSLHANQCKLQSYPMLPRGGQVPNADPVAG